MSVRMAFDADALIYAAAVGHPFQERILRHLGNGAGRYGSVLLINEVVTKPWREDPAAVETQALISILSNMELLPYTESTAKLGVLLGAEYGLRAADVVHLATAVEADMDVFITNNRKDFPKSVSEITILYPEDL